MGLLRGMAAMGGAFGVAGSLRRPAPSFAPVQVSDPRNKDADEPLRLMTLNVAHGRGDRILQTVASRRRTERHLDEVATLLRRHSPDVVALQEVDDWAFWSGRFNHADHLARAAGLASLSHARHVDGPGLGYGTALLSDLPIEDSSWGRFAPAPPTFRKGWACLSLSYPGGRNGRIEVVSVHLDFLRRRRREAQARELVQAFRSCAHSVIVMGDLNCGAHAQEDTLDILCEGLGLAAYERRDRSIVTYPRTRRRLDWIFVSQDLQFQHHAVLPECISDHLAVLAVVAPRKPGPDDSRSRSR